jgi:hypothetical protein
VRLHPELLELERHSMGYGGAGTLSTVVWPNGSISQVSQRASELVAAVALARWEMR